MTPSSVCYKRSKIVSAGLVRQNRLPQAVEQRYIFDLKYFIQFLTALHIKNDVFGDVTARTMVEVDQSFLLQGERHWIFTVIKLMIMKKGNEVQVGEIGNAHRNWIWKFKGKIPFVKIRCISKSDSMNVQIIHTLGTNLLFTTVAVSTRNCMCTCWSFLTVHVLPIDVILWPSGMWTKLLFMQGIYLAHEEGHLELLNWLS